MRPSDSGVRMYIAACMYIAAYACSSVLAHAYAGLQHFDDPKMTCQGDQERHGFDVLYLLAAAGALQSVTVSNRFHTRCCVVQSVVHHVRTPR